jgi:hypothetical protein
MQPKIGLSHVGTSGPLGVKNSHFISQFILIQWNLPYCIEPVPKGALSKHSSMQVRYI